MKEIRECTAQSTNWNRSTRLYHRTPVNGIHSAVRWERKLFSPLFPKYRDKYTHLRGGGNGGMYLARAVNSNGDSLLLNPALNSIAFQFRGKTLFEHDRL